MPFYGPLTHCILKNRFMIGREKPGTQSEVARLISETLEQEKIQEQHLEDHYEHSTEEVSGLDRTSLKCPIIAQTKSNLFNTMFRSEN